METMVREFSLAFFGALTQYLEESTRSINPNSADALLPIYEYAAEHP